MIIPASAQDPCLLTKQSLEGGAEGRPEHFTFKVMQWIPPRFPAERAC
jgi:hypothetical protein